MDTNPNPILAAPQQRIGEGVAVAALMERSGLKGDADVVRDLVWRRLMAQAEMMSKLAESGQ